MGAGSSSSILGLYGEGGFFATTGLGDMPEGCIAEMFLHLSPLDVCQLARSCRVFRGAASADLVWETKLPKNYRYLLGLAAEAEAAGCSDEGGDRSRGEEEEEVEGWKPRKRSRLCKKEIYALLSRPHPFDGGTKVFWLEKNRGQICLSVSSRAMLITGIDDRRYWKYIPTEESRFHTVAYLQQIWWFEVDGEINFCFPVGAYSLYFRLHLGRPSKRLVRRIYHTEQIHGWDIKPVRFQLSTSDGQRAVHHYHLDEPGTWILYHAGDFSVWDSSASTKVSFSMTQIDCTHTKGGLCVDCVYIYPKGIRLEKVISNEEV